MAFQTQSDNEYRIIIAKEAIRLMHTSGMTTTTLLNQIDIFVSKNGIPVFWHELENALKQYIPGICNSSELPRGILWINPPKTFYRMPDELLELYRMGKIPSPDWTDRLSGIHPSRMTPAFIATIRTARERNESIFEISKHPENYSQSVSSVITPSTSQVDAHPNATSSDAITTHALSEPVEEQILLIDEDEQSPFDVFTDHDTTQRLAKIRPYQTKFRTDVIARYGHQCAVCDVAIDALLEAAHIIPDNEGGSIDPRNGLVLCANHHRAFDADLFGIEPASLMVQVAPAYRDVQQLQMTRRSLRHLPAKPQSKALQWRYERWKGAGAGL